MHVAQRPDSVPATAPQTTRHVVRLLCRISIVAFVACHLWMVRYMTDADGTAYIDVARAYLQRDWAHAFNAYWSPLYIWLIATLLAVFKPSVHWVLPLIHVIALAGFIATLGAWEWLISEWERWKGPSSHPVLTDITGYCVVLWTGLQVTELGWYSNADVFVLAILIAATAIIVRIRRGAAPERAFAALGLLLGTGFLAKTAFLAVFPIFFFIAAVSLRSCFSRLLLITALSAGALVVPFVAATSITHGRFTIGDSGRLNYSWQVTGMSVEGYKENAYWPGPGIPHPIRVLLQNPRVLSFEQHLWGTLPVHADPVWWCEGYPVKFNKARQLMILWSNIRFSIYRFRCPALFLFLLCLPFGALKAVRNLAQAWFIWLPALSLALSYCFVYTLDRYLASSYAIFGFVLIAAVWQIRLPRSVAWGATWLTPVITVLFIMGGGFRFMLPQFVRDIAGTRVPLGYVNVRAAENAIRAGVRPGDRVAYIGFSLNAAHVGLERAHIVAIVPEKVTPNDRALGRPLSFTFPNARAFWRSTPQDQERVLEAFRSVGARWAFADIVPKSASTTGWQVAAEFDGGASGLASDHRPYIFLRRLY